MKPKVLRRRSSGDSDDHSELPQQPDTPSLLFNGLINEKTFIHEASPVSEAFERLCPTFNLAEAEAAFHENKTFLGRLCQELYYKLRVNNYRINYESPIISSTAEDTIWGSDPFEIYLPIRLPPGTPLRIQPEAAPGLIGIRIPASKRKPQPNEKDPLDFLKSSKRYVSSSVALKSTWKLVNNALQQLSAKYGQDVIIQDLTLNRKESVIDVILVVTSRYLQTRLASPKPGKADEDEEAVDSGAAFALHGDGDFVSDSAGEDDEEEDEEEEQSADEAGALEGRHGGGHTDGQAATGAQSLPHRGHRRRKEPEVTTKVLRLRLTPTIHHPSDNHAYLTPRPFSFAPVSANSDLWTVMYPVEEATLVRSLTRADRGLRIRAWRGVSDFCAAQTELRCISRDMLKHAMFHLAETEIDLVGIRWQRAALAHYAGDLLSCLRDHLQSASLPHFFYKDVDLLQSLPAHQLRSASLKIDFFLRKDTALVRAIQRTTEARTAA